MTFGFGSLIWIIKVLRCKESPNTKLAMIHVRTVIFCYVFLLVVRCLIAGLVIYKAWYFSSILGCYLSINFIDVNSFLKRVDEWDSDNRLTLYDIKKKYHL